MSRLAQILESVLDVARVSLFNGLAVVLLSTLSSVAFPSLASAAPEVDLHDLTWYVHVDLIDSGAGQDLAYWQGVIGSAVASANKLLEGGQGPFDQPCCTRLTSSVSLSTFGSVGDGRDVLDSVGDQNFFDSHGGAGSSAYLIDSLTYCGGSSPGAIGCAERPGCNGNGNDDPSLWMVVSLEAFDDDTLASVIAHERGHNSCLQHVAAADCQIMQATVFTPGLAGCFTASECDNYQAARTTTSSGLECGCHDDFGGLEADGTVCIEAAEGVCSGGLCGEYTGDAAVGLIASANPGTAAISIPDDALWISALAGDWTTLAQITTTSDDVRALTYATDSGTLYGVIPTVADDSIVTIDPSTGLVIATVGTLANGPDEIVSMAYDPGASSAPTDDRLLVLQVSGSSGQIRAIDPASPSTTSLLGSILWQPASLFTGLAYDSIQGKLFASTPFGPDGLYEIDLSSCPPSPCNSGQVAGAGLFREDGSLSYSRDSGMLYLVGTSFGGARTFYNVIDPVTGTSIETLSLDVFTPAGLAAVPEPGSGMALGAGVLSLAVSMGFRARRREYFPGGEVTINGTLPLDEGTEEST